MPGEEQKKQKGQRTKFVREIIHEIAGWAPYERRAMDLIKLERRRQATRYLKKRLGNHHRAIHKLNKLEEVIQEENLHHEEHK